MRYRPIEIDHADAYWGWAPNSDSAILKVAVASYERLSNIEPIARSIYAGLECGLFLEKYPNMDMISFGPILCDVYSPDERLNIETVDKFWKHSLDILVNIPSN